VAAGLGALGYGVSHAKEFTTTAGRG
jgi:hypothetical protein